MRLRYEKILDFLIVFFAILLIILSIIVVNLLLTGCRTYQSSSWAKPAHVGRSEVYKMPYGSWYYGNTPIRLEDINGKVQ